MNRIMKSALLLTVVVLAVPAGVAAQGRGNSDRTDSSARKLQIQERVSERKEDAAARVAEKRAAQEQRTSERLQQACERQSARLESAMTRASAQANRLLGVMDDFYDKVQGFYESNQLTVDDYDEQTQLIDAAKESAETEIAALAVLDEQVDCTDPEAVVNVRAYRDSAVAAKDALKEYRRTLVTLISSMRAASADQNNEDSSEDNAESTTDEQQETVEEETEEEDTENELENEQEQEQQ